VIFRKLFSKRLLQLCTRSKWKSFITYLDGLFSTGSRWCGTGEFDGATSSSDDVFTVSTCRLLQFLYDECRISHIIIIIIIIIIYFAYQSATRQSYITLRPRYALPSPPSRPIPFSANAAATE